MGIPLIFYGHEVFPNGLFLNVLRAFLAVPWLFTYLKAQKADSRLGMILSGYLFVLFLPNTIYLFAEFRHIIVTDNIADSREPAAVIVFGILSLLGLILALSLIYSASTKINFLKKNRILSMAALSYMSAWGYVLGMVGLTSLRGAICPHLIVEFTMKALTPFWILVTLVIGSIIMILCIILFFILESRKEKIA